jgi:hypothetical protein
MTIVDTVVRRVYGVKYRVGTTGRASMSKLKPMYCPAYNAKPT